MLADDIRLALPELRSEAEARMVDTCTIRRGPAGPGTFDSTTGTYTDPAATTVYSGVCEVQVTDGLTARETDVGETEITTLRLTVKVPVTATGIRVDDVATIDTATNDPDLVGKRFRVVGTHTKTYATARRLQVEEVAS